MAKVKFGNWQLYLDDTLAECDSQCFWDEFTVSDLSKKVRSLDSHLHSQNAAWIDDYFKKCLKSDSNKNDEIASKHRLKGNTFFQNKSFEQAKDCYDQCIRHAVWDKSGGQLALGLANRSAVFFHLQQYKECVEDISQALRHQYPTHIQVKLYVRQAQAYQRLAQSQLVKEVVEKGLRIIEESADLKVEEKEKYEKQLKKCCKGVESKSISVSNSSSDHVIPVHGFSTTIEQASSAVEVMFTKEKGRFLQAGRNLNAGDLIIHERPYAAVLLPPFYASNCQHCFADIKTFFPCSHCTSVCYCSEKCRHDSWTQYHSYECLFAQLLHSIGVAHLALRIVLLTPHNVLQKFSANEELAKCTDQMAGFNDAGIYSCDYASVFHLLSHHESLQRDDLFQYALTAAVLLRCLDHTDYFNESESERFSVGGFLLRHICQLVCNAHAITRLQKDEAPGAVVKIEQVRIATAIYPTTSLMNHSCDPSIIARTNELFVRLVKDVQSGEEIFNCYGPHYARMPKKERQEVLCNQYFFNCDCQECISDESFESLLKAFRCPKCSFPIVSEVQRCTKCTANIEMKKLKDAEIRGSQIFMDGLKCLQVENIDGSIVNLKKSLDIREVIYHHDHKLLSETRDALARCYCMKGHFTKATSLLKECLRTIEKTYGSHSIELANELHKFAEVLVNARRLEDALEVLEQSMQILQFNYGTEYPTKEEMQELKANIIKYK